MSCQKSPLRLSSSLTNQSGTTRPFKTISFAIQAETTLPGERQRHGPQAKLHHRLGKELTFPPTNGTQCADFSHIKTVLFPTPLSPAESRSGLMVINFFPFLFYWANFNQTVLHSALKLPFSRSSKTSTLLHERTVFQSSLIFLDHVISLYLRQRY